MSPLPDRLGPVTPQERTHVLRHGRVRDERQAELLEARPGASTGILAAWNSREEAVERDGLDLVAGQLGLDAAADDPRAPPGDRHGPALEQGLLVHQQLLLGRPAGEP